MYFDVSSLTNAWYVLPTFTRNASMWLVPRPHICAGPLHEESAEFCAVYTYGRKQLEHVVCATFAMMRTVEPSTKNSGAHVNRVFAMPDGTLATCVHDVRLVLVATLK